MKLFEQGGFMRIKQVLVMVLPVLLAAGCAGKMDAQRGLSEEWRLRSLEENFLNFKEGQRDQEERMNAQQRKVLDRVKSLEEAVVQLQERSGAGFMPPRAEMAPAPRPAAAPMRVAEPVRTAPPAQAVVPHTLSAKESDLAPDVVQGRSESAEDKPWAVVPSAPTYAAPAPMAPRAVAPMSASGLSGTALYNEGMTQVRAERSDVGRSVLEQFLAAEPNSALVPNALYWIGESYFQQKNFPQAILSFKDVTRRFPKHHKAAAALLKIGMAYDMLGEKDNATLYLRALLQDHPKSEPAPAARKKLMELGG